MPRYYFDLRDDRGLLPDDERVELPGIYAARQEAAHALPTCYGTPCATALAGLSAKCR